jgi:putative membrane protein
VTAGAVLTSRADHVPIGRPSRTSPLTNVLELAALLTIGGSLAIALVVGVDAAELAQGGIAILAVLARLVGWWFRTYTVTGGELLLDEGVLQRTHRVVPFSRIQQVEVRQKLVPRVLGIATIHIETAADSGSTAVTLRALTLDRAEALRDHLLAEQHRVRGGRVGAADGLATPEVGAPWLAAARTPLVRLTPGQLLAAGATSTPTISLLPFVLLGSGVVAALLATALDLGALVTAGLVVVLAAGGATVFAAIGAVTTLVESWGFELATAGDDLHLSHGLLDRRQHTMPRQRLQHARVVDNPVRRRLGTTSVHLHSAATPGRGDEQQASIDIPLVASARLGDLLATVMGSDDFRPPALQPRPPAARRRAVVRRLLLSTLPAVAIAAIWWPVGAGVLPFALVGIPWGLAAHRRAGHALDGRVLAVASGAIAHRLELIPRARLQSVRTSANPLQRRADLTSLHLDVAGTKVGLLLGGPGLHDAGSEVAADALRRLTS